MDHTIDEKELKERIKKIRGRRGSNPTYTIDEAIRILMGKKLESKKEKGNGNN